MPPTTDLPAVPAEDHGWTELLAASRVFCVVLVCFVVLAASLSALGLNFITAISGAATAICNVGPGLGESIGPTGNFGSLPEMAKWLLSLGMLLGRLELFTVLVMFSPAFWTR